MDELHALIGRKQVELETMHREYAILLGVLADVVAGEIAPARVTVDRAARSWSVTPLEPLALVPTERVS